jgi:copper homeostasis protein
MLRPLNLEGPTHSVKRVLVEIAAHTLESAITAQAGGADRVELFSNPLEGGVTPSEGLIAVVRKRISLDLGVVIRPRGGDFYYSDEEFEAMLEDVATAKRLGANGVAVGLVNPDGTVDSDRVCKLVSAARPLSVTFHRASDMCKDLPVALESLISCGVDRVLTSGGEVSALEGIEPLARLVRIAGDRISIIAAGGIRAENARQIVQQTGVREVHAGLRSRVSSPMQFRNHKVSFGPGANEYERVIVKDGDVRRLAEELTDL